MNIHPDVLKIKDTIISNRRDIHRHPELSFQEYRTSELVAKQLESFGLEVERNIGKTGIVGTLKGELPGKTIAFRADMDALPIQETSDVPYKSVNDGIAAVQVLIENDRLLVDVNKCGHTYSSLSSYKWNPRTENPKPVHDWASHASDAVRYAIYTHQKRSVGIFAA